MALTKGFNLILSIPAFAFGALLIINFHETLWKYLKDHKTSLLRVLSIAQIILFLGALTCIIAVGNIDDEDSDLSFGFVHSTHYMVSPHPLEMTTVSTYVALGSYALFVLISIIALVILRERKEHV